MTSRSACGRVSEWVRMSCMRRTGLTSGQYYSRRKHKASAAKDCEIRNLAAFVFFFKVAKLDESMCDEKVRSKTRQP